MDYSERSRPEPKPQFNSAHPETIFMFGAEKQRWLRRRVSQKDLPAAIGHLANDLDRYMVSAFDDMPELELRSDDIISTQAISGGIDRGHNIMSELLVKSGDAELFGEHALRAFYYGFHKGHENYDLRVYVSTVDQMPINLPGGVYKPLLSVGVEGSYIELASEANRKQLRALQGSILRQTSDIQDPELGSAVDTLLHILNTARGSSLEKLQKCSPLIAAVEGDQKASAQLTDLLLEYTKKSLRLDAPQLVKTLVDPTTFEGVTPELGMVGEPDARTLAVMFMMNDRAVQIPAQHISIIEQER